MKGGRVLTSSIRPGPLAWPAKFTHRPRARPLCYIEPGGYK